VLVVDDDESVRALIAAHLQRIGCVVYEASAGDEALELAELVRPALAVLDVNLPRVTGYEVCRGLRELMGASVAIMFISGYRSESLDRIAGLLIGADDYIVKPFDPGELVARARALLARRSAWNGHHGAGETKMTDALTAREREVLVLLASGSTQDDIASSLVVSPKTVATHIQRTLTKLGVHSRAQAVAVAYRAGLLTDEVDAHSIVGECA